MKWRLPLPFRRPRLTVSILTKNSEDRLEAVIGDARHYANEVVVGVDADSSDGTWQVACRCADTVYRFKHAGQIAPIHMLALSYCQGEWILRLDDDEFMERGFATILPELLSTLTHTHYHLPRKWVVSLDPPLYLHASPWYPDHALRLFRNDPSLVWKPPRYHTGYWVAGLGAVDNRYAILHYEPVWCTPARRAEKVRAYHDHGGAGAAEAFYGQKEGERRPFSPPIPARHTRRPRSQIDPMVREPPVRALPPWGARIESCDLPAKVRAGQRFPVCLNLVNIGAMSWLSNQVNWPVLNVAFQIRTLDGTLLERDGCRIPIRGLVRPSQSARVCGTVTAYNIPGDFLLAWDVVSEHECWFAECGSVPFVTPVMVI